MMRSIVKMSIEFRYLIVTIAVAIVLVSISQLGKMSVDALPEFSPPYVEIQTEALGLSAEEVEQMITVPMEQDLLAGVAWLDVIHSESVPGLSSVVIYFEPGTDIYRARQLVAERLSQAAVGLPHVSQPPTMIQPLSSSSRFIIVGLSSQDLSLIEMSVLARWVISPRLMGVPGVAHVAIWGNRDRQLQVQVAPEQLQDAGVTLQQVIETTGNALWVSSLSYLEASTPGAGGFIDTPNQRLGIWHVLPIKTPADLSQVPVEGTAWRLGDVAQVVEDHQPLIGDAIVNDNPNLLLVIEKLPGVNTLEVTRGLEEGLDALKPGFAGINFDATVFRPATFIEMAISNLTQALIIAAVLLVLVLGAFLYGWRPLLISLIVIPLSLLAALLVLYQRGATMNMMVLAGLVLALGVIIDEAIVDIENIIRRLRQNHREGNPTTAEMVILEASAEMRNTLFFALLITLLAVVPVISLEGLSSALFGPLALTYVFAVLAAMVVALTLTPALAVIFFSNAQIKDSEPPLVAWLQRGYSGLLARTTQGPRLVYAIVLVLVVAAVVVLPSFGQNQLLPSFKEPYLTVQLEADPGTSLQAMNGIVSKASADLRAVPGVRNVAAHVGRAVFGDQVVNVNSAQLWVSIDPAADHDSTVAAIQQTVKNYSEMDVQVQTYLQQTINNAQTNTFDGFAVRVNGEDHKTLRDLAEDMRQTLAGIPGVVNPQVMLPLEEPTVEIEVDLTSAQRFGVKPGDVRRSAATLLSGVQVGSLFEEQKVFDVVVWGVPEIRDNVEDIKNLLIDTPGGGHVQLGEVADVRVASSPAVINREGISPYLDIVFDVEGSPRAVIEDVSDAIQGFTYPLEYHAVVLENYTAQQATMQRILISVIVALFGIFLFLQAAFRSWSMALMSVITLPIALTGSVLAAFVGSGGLLSLSSLAGLLPIIALTLRNSILLVSHYQHLEEHEGEAFGLDLVLRGSRERITPIIMSILTTILVLLPFMLLGNNPGFEIVRPTAFVILGGLVTSTLLNLFVMPLVYLRFGASREADLGLASMPVASEA